jgi:uncharacterized membrane protein
VKLSTRDIAIAGVLSAVTVLLAITHLGFIPFIAGTSITIMHVPVIIGAILAGPVVGTLIGLIFGISSLIVAAVAPTGPGDVLFTNPLVSVLPRLFIGIVAAGVYQTMQKAKSRVWAVVLGVLFAVLVVVFAWRIGAAGFRLAPVVGVAIGALGLALIGMAVYRAFHAEPEEVAMSIAAVLGTLTNTTLVLTMLVVCGYIPAPLAVSLGIANAPLEMVAAAVITVTVVSAWQHAVNLRAGRSRG